MIPPWEKFPTYERFTIGWRMGIGEEYIGKWCSFVDRLPKDFSSRLSYLKQHEPAPLNWGKWVLDVLYPGQDSEEEFGCSQTEILQLLDLKLVAYDAAYQIWLKQQSDIAYPWLLFPDSTPQKVSRYWTRDFWFSSRQIEANHQLIDLQLNPLPPAWQSVEKQLLTGELGDADVSQGLLTLAQMLCAGRVQPPWSLGLSPDDFADSFEMDMGYVDAYQLWIMSAFDDDLLFRQMLQETGIPNDWIDWIEEQADFA